MPAYVYETVPEQEGDPVKQCDILQHVKDDPLERHPRTGVAGRQPCTYRQSQA